MSVLRFQTNVPVEVALAYSDGKEVEGNYGPQVMFSLATAPNGEQTMYVPPIVANRIAELHIGKGELFEVCKAELKNGNRRGMEWQVKRVDSNPRWQEPAPANPRPEPLAPSPAKVNGAAAPVQGPGSDPGNGQSTTKPANGNGNGTGNGHAAVNGIPYWDPKTEWLRCADDAIDALVTARDHAASKGLPVQFTGEDLRQVAATLYIDRGKDRRCPNGGLR